MNNVGQTKSFLYTASPPQEGLRYVFEFLWDNTVEVNTTGQATKKLNMGGNPANGFNLVWSGTAVDERGNAKGNRNSFVVNNPPVIVQSPQATVNDAVFPYDTTLSLVAYDLEGHTPLEFNWYRNGTLLQSGQGVPDVRVDGTYGGAWTGFSYPTQRSSFVCSGSTPITQPEMVRVDVVDSEGGTTTLNFSLLGRRPTNPYGAPMVETSSLVADATGTAHQRVGLYQKARFVIHTEVLDEAPVAANENDGKVWHFPQNRGWRAIAPGQGILQTERITRLASGAYRLEAEKPLDRELAGPNFTAREATVEAAFKHKGKSAQSVLSIILLPNHGPEDVQVEVALATGNPIPVVAGALDVPRSAGRIRFIASGVDPDLDLVSFRWSISAGRSTLSLRGRTAVVDISGLANDETVTGNLYATDRFGFGQPGGATTLPTITVKV